MTRRTLMVTGASGQLGRQAVQALLALGDDVVIAGTRSPDKVADLAATGAQVRTVDFDDPELARAFAGVDRLLLVSTDSLDRPGRRAEQHIRAIRAAVAAGVKHIAYTSFSNPTADSVISLAEDHRRTEEALAASGVGYTALRNNLYADLLLQQVPAAVESGKLVTARGEGAIAYVTRADCARAAANALADAFDGVRVLEISGPAAVTGDELAATIQSVTGNPVEHVSVPGPSLHAGMVQAGLPDFVASMLVTFEEAAARGELDRASQDVARLTGRPATSVRDFLASHQAA